MSCLIEIKDIGLLKEAMIRRNAFYLSIQELKYFKSIRVLPPYRVGDICEKANKADLGGYEHNSCFATYDTICYRKKPI